MTSELGNLFYNDLLVFEEEGDMINNVFQRNIYKQKYVGSLSEEETGGLSAGERARRTGGTLPWEWQVGKYRTDVIEGEPM